MTIFSTDTIVTQYKADPRESEMKWPDVERMFGAEPLVAWDRDMAQFGWMPMLRIRSVTPAQILEGTHVERERIATMRATGIVVTCFSCKHTISPDEHGYTITLSDNLVEDVTQQGLIALVSKRILDCMREHPCFTSRAATTTEGLVELWADDADCGVRVQRMGERACRCVYWSGLEWKPRISPVTGRAPRTWHRTHLGRWADRRCAVCTAAMFFSACGTYAACSNPTCGVL